MNIRNIDWELFHKQKTALVLLTENHKTTPDEVENLTGVIHLMDAIQDKFMPVPVMRNYVVLYRDEKVMCPADSPFGFQCYAETGDHAEEQCQKAYPGVDVVWVWQGQEGVGMQPALDDYYTAGMPKEETK